MFRFFSPAPTSPSPEYRSAGAFVSKLVLPAQRRPPLHLDEADLRHHAYSNGLKLTTDLVPVNEDTLLDTMELTPVHFNPNEHVTIVRFNGNGGLYQDEISLLMADANRLPAKMVSFNYRGVGLSSGSPFSYQDLVVDGMTQVERQISMGTPSTKILLDGYSLGASVATFTALHFHRLQQPMYLWNDRSFSVLSEVSANLVTQSMPYLLQPFTAPLLNTATHSLMPLFAWQANAAQAYLEIPAEYRGYMVVTKASGEACKRSYGDGLIPHLNSLHKGVAGIEKQQRVKTGFKVRSLFENGHNHDRSSLVAKNQPDINGQQLFDLFVRKI